MHCISCTRTTWTAGTVRGLYTYCTDCNALCRLYLHCVSCTWTACTVRGLHAPYMDCTCTERTVHAALQMQDLGVLEEVLRMVLEIVNSCLTHSLHHNPHLVYTLLYQRGLFAPFRTHPTFQDIIQNIDTVSLSVSVCVSVPVCLCTCLCSPTPVPARTLRSIQDPPYLPGHCTEDSVSLSVCLCVCTCLSAPVCLYLSVYLSVCVHRHLYQSGLFAPFKTCLTFQDIRQNKDTVSLSVCLSAYLRVYMSVFAPVCQCTCLCSFTPVRALPLGPLQDPPHLPGHHPEHRLCESLSLCLSVCLHTSVCTCLSLHLSV